MSIENVKLNKKKKRKKSMIDVLKYVIHKTEVTNNE